MDDNKKSLEKTFERLDEIAAPFKISDKLKDVEFRAPEIYRPDFSEMLPETPNILPNFSEGESPLEIIGEMKKELEKSNQEVAIIKLELQKERDSHKHDTLKQILITLLGCTVSFLLGYFLH